MTTTIEWWDRNGGHHRATPKPSVDPNTVLANIRRNGGTIRRVSLTPREV